MKKSLLFATISLLAATAFAQTSEPFGTFARPFAADSPWNIRPLNPVLGTYAPPLTPPQNWYPMISSGNLSTRAFLASETDQPMVIYPEAGQPGVWDADARESKATVTIPRWPADTFGASGGDGHADIFDPVSGKIHSFWKLRFKDGKWTAVQHAWTSINGRGWGDPSHNYQGARAAGVPSIGGMIRTHEVNDGQPYYQHALAMSMSREGLAGNPAYVYPATSADKDSNVLHKGQVPEGALMMLPHDYTMQIDNPLLEKVVETLKVYGARVVDENTGTPFAIYAEIGAPFNLLNGNNSHDYPIYQELERMRQAMRQVVSASGYVDGNGNPTTANVPTGKENLLSMRGPWTPYTPGSSAAPFNTFTQSVEYPALPTVTEQQNGNGTGIGGGSIAMGGVTWARPVAGATYRLTAIGTGNAAVRIVMYSGSSQVGGTPYLTNGQSANFVWPASGGWATVWTKNGVNQAGSIRATMIRQ